MSKKLGLGLTALALLAVTIGITLASAAPKGARPADSVGPWGRDLRAARAGERITPRISGAETLRVVERPKNFKFVNTNGRDFTPGDYFLFVSDLFRHGRQVGTDNVKCTAFFSRRVVCEAAANIRGRGQIAVGGIVPNQDPFALPITGGTGDFQNARGQLIVESARGGNSILTFELIP